MKLIENYTNSIEDLFDHVKAESNGYTNIDICTEMFWEVVDQGNFKEIFFHEDEEEAREHEGYSCVARGEVFVGKELSATFALDENCGDRSWVFFLNEKRIENKEE